MAAITATKVQVLRGLVTDLIVGSSADNLAVVEIVATTTATSNTLDLSTVVPCTGVLYRLACSIDEADEATADTWSGTTVTFASHAGSGRYRGLFLIKQ